MGAVLFGQGQPAAPVPSSTDITIADQSVILYPSLIPVYQLKLDKTDPNFELPHDPGGYTLTVNGKVSKVVSAVHPTRTAGKDDWSVVYLVLIRPNIRKGDKLVVTAKDAKSRMDLKSNELPATAGTANVSFGVTPSFVQSEALENGAKRPVGQANVTLDEQNIPLSTSFRTHLTTNSIISTDEKDKSSNANLLFGTEWNLIRSWYLPFHLDTKVMGDQVINNASSVSSAGVTTLIPWGWTRSFLNNPILDAPLSPLFTFDTQFQRQFREDAAALKISRSRDLFRLHGRAAWTPIRFLKGDGTGDYVSLSIGGQGWYIPADRTSANVVKDRLEGAFQATVLIPAGKLSTPSEGVGLTTAQKGTKSIIQIQYSRGANEATGFKHSTQLSIGLQVSSTN